MPTANLVSRAPRGLGRPLGTGRDWRRRLLLHHATLALASTVAFALLMGLADGSFLAAQLTTVTGYVATGLLALTLLVGPGNLLRAHRRGHRGPRRPGDRDRAVAPGAPTRRARLDQLG